MRLAGQIKGGFYPVPDAAVDVVRDRLSRPLDGAVTVLDPCAGQGDALHRFAMSLGAVPYAIELDENRADTVREKFPAANVLAPADFLGCRISTGWASFVWLNPPFTQELGWGCRVELRFLDAAWPLLAKGGVLALACPESVAESYQVCEFFDRMFEDICAFPYPAEHRKYNETVIMGRKAEKPADRAWPYGKFREWGQERYSYALPPGRTPGIWEKWELTDAELAGVLPGSPIRFLLRPEPGEADDRPRPPMSPSDGHRALLLASGLLGGLIEREGEEPHVVRGTATKTTYLKEEGETENKDGSVTERTVYGERLELQVRTLDHEGNLQTLV